MYCAEFQLQNINTYQKESVFGWDILNTTLPILCRYVFLNPFNNLERFAELLKELSTFEKGI